MNSQMAASPRGSLKLEDRNTMGSKVMMPFSEIVTVNNFSFDHI